MNKLTLIFSAAMIVGSVSCKNAEEKKSTMSVAELNAYVDSVKNVTPVYTDSSWAAIDRGYQVRAIRAEAELVNLKEEEKVRAQESKEQYAALKMTYNTEIQNQKKSRVIEQKQKLRNNLFGEGKIGDDMSFDFVNAQNIRGVYEGFVNAVAENKEVYSREDWDEIKVLYEALDTRKNTVEKDLAGKDNLAIAKQKVRFSEMYTVRRPGSKLNENSEAKE
jgi:hypothetical protein